MDVNSEDGYKESLEMLISNMISAKGDIMPLAMEIVEMLDGAPLAVPVALRIMATKIQSAKEKEAMHGLTLLDICMKECGAHFQAEVGKFRFLNELIKLVSPKYLGGRTPPQVRQKVLTLLHKWTEDYSHETKILEAYDMLKKQGVIGKEDLVYFSPKCEESAAAASRAKSIFEDDDRSRLLQKLLQSKNPDDLQAANRLIKNMVKEDERRAELNARRSVEVEKVRNNAKLLCEMLASYIPGSTTPEELELIKQVHESCERLRPLCIRIASETQDNDEVLADVLIANDMLADALDKYVLVIEQGMPLNSPNINDSLLDLSTPNEEKLQLPPVTWLHQELQGLDLDKKLSSPADTAQQSSFDVLEDIFGPLTPNASSAAAAATAAAPVAAAAAAAAAPAATTAAAAATAAPAAPVAASIVHAEPTVLQPVSPTILQPVSLLFSTGKTGAIRIEPEDEEEGEEEEEEKKKQPKGLTELDLLGEIMLKDSLPPSIKHQSSFNRPPMKIPMNLLGRPQAKSSNKPSSEASSPLDLRGFEEKILSVDIAVSHPGRTFKKPLTSSTLEEINGDDSMVDISERSVELHGAMSVSLEASKDAISEDQSLYEAVSDSGSAGAINVDNSFCGAVMESEKSVEGNKDTRSRSHHDSKRVEAKSLADIFVSLDSIKPGSIPPYTILDEEGGLSVVLHFARDAPRPDVSVVVVTTTNRNIEPITSFLFQAGVPKTCRLRLLPPSGSDLPAHNPFLPPSAITQVLLIANPNKDPVSLKYMISYTLEGETITEMGEVEKLPLAT